MGEMFTIADPYAFVILRWTGQFGIDLAGWPELKSYRERIAERPAVRQALREEGLPTA
jgi:glutathione S-transferase